MSAAIHSITLRIMYSHQDWTLSASRSKKNKRYVKTYEAKYSRYSHSLIRYASTSNSSELGRVRYQPRYQRILSYSREGYHAYFESSSNCTSGSKGFTTQLTRKHMLNKIRTRILRLL